ncbi:hypothetical protein JKF63_02244 [Porcisia hertigi]|uniref:Kinesin-like protein n=1 Tax=Porcisia hertigi TaxID=2761500 RepID=A0A836HP77_9TRYP|nr:hypothetical protein JKF63_02244 [Porcisia hertigi]
MSIEVHVRIRPSVANVVWSSAETVLYSTANPNTRYVYNKVYPSNSTNESIFHGMEAIVHAAFDGKNVTVMAYGQTGSGKTHSMIGIDQDPGMVPRTAKLLLELKRTTPGTKIQAFYTEIYNESVKDLLEPQRGELALHDAPDGGVYFEKKMVGVETFDDFIQLQSAAERNRKYGVTNLNEHSSRSHVILTFEIHRHSRLGKSVINLVDLAGSESASRANTEGISLREGGFINRSLLTLGNVVDAIVDRRPHIPYRDAKLTRLLRTCLGGSGITLVLCCVNPSRENFEQTVSTLRFTQRAMKIKNDPVVVLNMPPLFTHQYSDGARQLIEGLQESAEAEYQRGLRDSFLYCSSTVGSVVRNFQAQVSDCLHSLANAQRLLVAHDHAMAIDHIGQLYNQQNDLMRQRINNQGLAENERKRQRDVASEIECRKEKIAKLGEELTTKVSSLDTNLAGWEYQLYEARQKQRSEMDVLVQLELARRARIQYEWVVCFERIASRSVPVIQAGFAALQEKLVERSSGSSNGSGDAPDEHQQHHPLPTISSWKNGDAEQRAICMRDLRTALMKARDELSDLTTAHEMVKDDIEEARRQQQQDRQRGATSVSPQPRPSLSDLAEEDLVEYYRGVGDSEVEDRIHRLEREEKALMAQARRGVRRESLRRVRESLHVSRASRGGRSRSLQGGTTVTRRTEATAAGASSNVPPRLGSATADEEGRAGVLQTGVRTQAEARDRRSSASYADGVKNALSILDSLKAQLQRKGGNGLASPTIASASRSRQTQSQRQPEAVDGRGTCSVSSSSEARRRQGRKGVDETVVYCDPEKCNVGEGRQRTASRSAASGAAHRHHPTTALGSTIDTENTPLAELYQVSMGKENWTRPKSSAAAAVSQAVSKYTTVEEDNVAFDTNEEADVKKEDGRPVSNQLTSSPPIGIAARRKLRPQTSRPAVERALYTLNSNSHSPSPSVERRSRSRRA